MALSKKKVTPKRRPGRPATGKDPLITMRLPQEMIDALDTVAKGEGASRSEIIRRLIEAGLKRRAKA
jgi:hypothetical protein